MEIKIAETDEEILACYSVIKELRPHIEEGGFLVRIWAQYQQGYRLTYAHLDGDPVAVAGFRVGDNLAWGHFLYVDDLVTLLKHRSMGYGAALLHWLETYALQQGCKQIHLDTGLERVEAQRFYQREAMQASGYHFVKTVSN